MKRSRGDTRAMRDSRASAGKGSVATAAATLQRKGLAYFERGQSAAAIAALAEAARLAPTDAAVRETHAELLARAQRWPEAGAEALAALACGPASASLHDLLGRIMLERGEHEAALGFLGASLAVRPAHAGTLVNLGVVLQRIGEWELALQAAESALRVQPELVAARLGASLALHALGRTDAALAALGPAGTHPRARFNVGFIRAHHGELAAALALMEARLELHDPGAGHGPRWRGERLDGTLLVVPEQGLGDALLMCGFLVGLPARAREVVVQAPLPLVRLFETAFPALRVVASLQGVRADAHVSMMSLAHLAGVRTRADFPVAPWLCLPAVSGTATRPRVGLNWAGNPRFAYDAIRSTSLATLAPLLEETDVEWVSLHKGAREHEAVAAGLATPLADATDFLDTAHVIAGLDLVISTETAMPNLSAALGVPTVVLTHPAPDWRWSHAYSGVTVAAQLAVGDWSRPITIARACVRSLTTVRAAA